MIAGAHADYRREDYIMPRTQRRHGGKLQPSPRPIAWTPIQILTPFGWLSLGVVLGFIAGLCFCASLVMA